MIAANDETDDPLHSNSRSSGCQQSRTAGELDPLGFDSIELRVHRTMPRDGDDEMRRFDFRPQTPSDGSETAADFVPLHCIANALRDGKAELRVEFIRQRQNGDDEQASCP